MVFSVLFGFLGGRWLDGKLDTAPWLATIGLVLGVATAIRFLVRAARRMQRATERDGFKASQTDRSAKFAMQQRERGR